jgi:hypothetical protein
MASAQLEVGGVPVTQLQEYGYVICRDTPKSATLFQY